MSSPDLKGQRGRGILKGVRRKVYKGREERKRGKEELRIKELRGGKKGRKEEEGGNIRHKEKRKMIQKRVKRKKMEG